MKTDVSPPATSAAMTRSTRRGLDLEFDDNRTDDERTPPGSNRVMTPENGA